MKQLSFFRIVVCVVVACSLAWLTTTRGRAAPSTVITVTNADASRNLASVQSSGLGSEVNAVGSHFSVQFGESVRMVNIPAWPSALGTLLNDVGAHFKVQFVESLRIIAVPTLAVALDTLLTNVHAHVVLGSAEANRSLSLAFPSAIINDSAPPVIGQIKALPMGGGQVAAISWTTDEFANSIVRYGSRPGTYPSVVTDTLYFKNHTVTLTGLTVGNTYYYRVRSVDLNGNQANSAEQSFVAQSTNVYLPLIRK